MLLSLNWLKEFVPYTGSAQELGDRLTSLGLELEEILHPFSALKDLVTGYVLECTTHPDADKLSVCKVDVGKEILEIVCGAPNVAQGQYVAVAPVGATLPGGLVIKNAKLRGVNSFGMLCSERELGLSDEHDGIMVLDKLLPGEPITIGEPLLKVLKLDEEVLEISITPNRADCLSVLGLARETAMAFNLPLSMPEFDLHESGADFSGEFKVEITDPSLSAIYQLRLVEGVSVKRSPARLRWRLQAAGLRSISNVVDITNYILMELGQPLHAFDPEKLKGGLLSVSPAKQGEVLKTLDGQDRTLVNADITIRDAEKAVALAGVMGGENSQITDASHAVILESAVFRPESVRRTARRLSLSSDASYRFERGVDQAIGRFAVDKAAFMIANAAGGTVRKGVVAKESKTLCVNGITFRPEKAVSLIGVELPEIFMVDTLTSLNCTIENQRQKEWNVTPPSYRLDLFREADLIEEIARVYGVDRVPEILPRVGKTIERSGLPETRHALLARIKRWGAGLGLNEVINYSFVGQKDLDHLELPENERIAIMNPLTSEQDVLRTTLAPGLLQNLKHNIAQGNTAVRIFEIANTFFKDSNSETGVREETRIAFLMHGDIHDSYWPHKPADADYLDLKGIVENLFHYLRVEGASFEMADASSGMSPNATGQSWLLPCVAIKAKGQYLGFMGRIRPAMADAFHARKDVWVAEIFIDIMQKLGIEAERMFKNLSVYPPVRRDITVMAPKCMFNESIRESILKEQPKFLEEVELLDLFTPQDNDERNLTFRLTFRHPERTLKDDEVDKVRDAVAKSLTSIPGVRV